MKRDKENPVDLVHLKYDLTPEKFLSMIVCEIGNIPPHSVPVVIREIMNDNDDIDDEWKRKSSQVHSSNSDDDSNDELGVNEINAEIQEAAIEGEEESDDEGQRLQIAI